MSRLFGSLRQMGHIVTDIGTIIEMSHATPTRRPPVGQCSEYTSPAFAGEVAARQRGG